MSSLETRIVPIAEDSKPQGAGSRFRSRTRWLILLIAAGGLVAWGAERRELERIEQRERLELALVENGAHSCDSFRVDGKDWVWATAKGDAGLKALAELKSLQILDLTDSRVTDAGLAHLEKLHRLERIRLDGTDVTDVGLEHLRGLPRLRSVFLYATQVTERGVAELKRALPDAEIAW